MGILWSVGVQSFPTGLNIKLTLMSKKIGIIWAERHGTLALYQAIVTLGDRGTVYLFFMVKLQTVSSDAAIFAVEF